MQMPSLNPIAMYRVHRNTPMSKLRQRLADAGVIPNAKRQLMDYPFPDMNVNDTVVFKIALKGSYPTIKRAASRYGTELGRYYQTSVLDDGTLAVQRIY
jgi:hypothetical protein